MAGQEAAVPETVSAFVALECSLFKVPPSVFQGFVQRARSPPAHLAPQPGGAARVPGWVPDGVVDQQRTLLSVCGAGANGAGEALDGDVHGGESRHSDGTAAPRLHLHHAALYPQLRQQLLLVELRLQSAPLLPQDQQLPAGVFTQGDTHQPAVSHDAVNHYSPFFLSVLPRLPVPLLEVF